MDHPLDLSILVRGGRDSNSDLPSSGERRVDSPASYSGSVATPHSTVPYPYGYSSWNRGSIESIGSDRLLPEGGYRTGVVC